MWGVCAPHSKPRTVKWRHFNTRRGQRLRTLTGSVREARCSFLTLEVMVAENRRVLRSRGMA
jgi:hypothetical protein